MTLLDLMVKIGAQDDASSVIDSVVNKTKSATSVLGGVASTVGKVGGAMAGAAAAGVAALTKSATESYADYEQLVGGVETLFGTGGRSLEEYAAWVGKSVSEVQDEYKALSSAQEAVLGNATSAYKDAGLSANEYMETATSFAASLVSSLGGDTVAAASMVQTAITDMSDNANKMGTDIGMIQNAYQGFAKQNYTMLDNLKLGYGGTAGEMARLLNDANKIDSSILGSGVELATTGQGILDGVGLDQMILAINTIQQKMDITGTTAKEAASTIQGSVAMTKSAWQNMLTGIADDDADFGGLVDNLVTSVDAALSNLLPRIQTSLSGVADLIGSLAPATIDEIPGILDSVLPGVTEGVTAIISSITQALPGIVDAVVSAIPNLVSSIESIGDTLLESLVDLAGKLADGVAVAFESLTGINLSPIVDGLKDALGEIKNLFSDLFDGFSLKDNGVITLINDVIKSLGDAISYVVRVVKGESFQKIVNSVTSLFKTVGGSLSTSLKPAGDALKEFFRSFVAGDAGLITKIADAFGKLAVWFDGNIATVITAVAEGIGNLVSSFVGASLDVIEGVVSAFITLFGSLGESEGESSKKVSDAIVSMIGAFSESVATIIQYVADSIVAFVQKLAANEQVVAAFKSVVAGLRDIFERMKTSVITIAEKMEKLFKATSDFSTSWDQVWSSAGEVVGAAVHAIGEHLSAIWEKIIAMKDALVGLFKDFSLENLWSGITDGASSLWDKAKSAVGSFVDGVKTGYADAEAAQNAAANARKTASSSLQNTEPGYAVKTPDNINLTVNIDGQKVADAVYNPLRNLSKQKGMTY